MKPNADEALDRELGNALADRLGLNHATTLQEYEAEQSRGKVKVTMHSVLLINRDEYEDLVRVAARRAAAA